MLSIRDRREKAKEIIENNKGISIKDLSKALGVSSATATIDRMVVCSKTEIEAFKHHNTIRFRSFRARAKEFRSIDTLSLDDLADIVLKSNGYCFYCRKKFDPLEIECDHIIPLSRGGDNSKYNIVTCCKSCNRKKKDNYTILSPKNDKQAVALRWWYSLTPAERLDRIAADWDRWFDKEHPEFSE